MSARFLLDTNIVSEPLRPRPSATVLRQLQAHEAEIAVAAVVWHELWFGCRRLPPGAKRSAIEDFLDEVVGATMPVLPYEARAAEWHAAERARLMAAGKTPAFADGQIAAVAITNGLILVTRNLPDFADFEDLQTVDWAR
ncbi:MAG: type II toxin-antitoxin system VapC family toxin [Anaerolineales bacterium]|nr:type II toxin-antitoxin system VapC family toxin [Anaerolineales bacterium]